MSQMCEDAGFILGPITLIVKILHWAIPIILIVLIVFDFFKVVVGHADEKEKKEALNKALKRIIYATIVFLVPTIVNIVFQKIEPVSVDKKGNITSTSTSYLGCWNYYYTK